jgi:prohibitin 2
MLTLTTMYIFFLHSSIVIKAQGEARAAELVGKAIQKNPAFIQLRRIEAAKDVASTVANSQNKIYLNSDNLLLNHLGEAPSLSTGGTEKKGW